MHSNKNDFQDLLHCLHAYAEKSTLDEVQFKEKYHVSKSDFQSSVKHLTTFMTYCEVPRNDCTPPNDDNVPLYLKPCACENEIGLNNLIDGMFKYISYTLHEWTSGDIYKDAKASMHNTRHGDSCEDKLNHLGYFLEIILDSQFKVMETFFEVLKGRIDSYISSSSQWSDFLKQLKTDMLCVINEQTHAKKHDFRTIFEYIDADGKAGILNIHLLLLKDHFGKVDQIQIVSIEAEDSDHYEQAFGELFS